MDISGVEANGQTYGAHFLVNQMVFQKHVGHIAFQFEQGENVFDLGYKVLLKNSLYGAISCICIKFNLQDKVLYNTEGYEVLSSVLSSLSEKEILSVIYGMAKICLEINHNDFIPKEALQMDANLIYWDKNKGLPRFLVLPTSKEYFSGDYRSWDKRYRDVINNLLVKFDSKLREQILELFDLNEDIEKINSKILEMVEKLIDVSEEYSPSCLGELSSELRLSHNGKYGQISFSIRKHEFIIGKKRESVDGYLNISNAVSRLHCKIVNRDNRFFIVDLGSKNHTFVNGMLVKSEEYIEIHNGDMVKIADINFIADIRR